MEDHSTNERETITCDWINYIEYEKKVELLYVYMINYKLGSGLDQYVIGYGKYFDL